MKTITPKPWKSERRRAVGFGGVGDYDYFSIVGGEEGRLVEVATVVDHHGSEYQGQAEPNAQLIAAAPELLEALQELVAKREEVCRKIRQPEYRDGSDGRYARARTAIAKALGES